MSEETESTELVSGAPTPEVEPAPADLRARILEVASEMFAAQGYSKVSMSEIAQELHLSKKTLYREFEDKEDLLRAVLFPKMRKSAEETDCLLADASIPYVKKLERLMEIIAHRAAKSSSVLVRDLSTHAPLVWQEYMKFKRSRLDSFQQLIEFGINTGELRSDISPTLVTRFYAAALEQIITPAALSELPFTAAEVARMLVSLIFEGLLTADARSKLRTENAIGKELGEQS